MPTIPLDISFLNALAALLKDKAVSSPPTDIIIDDTSIKVGRWQANPEKAAPVITLHIGDPEATESSGWAHEFRKGSGEIAGNCCAGLWDYRYTIHIRYFMTRTREAQDEALEKGSRLAQWVASHAGQCVSTAELVSYGMQSPSDFGETSLMHQILRIETREGGGPRSYISNTVLFIQQLVSRS